jgi:hypothetical protein
VKLLSLLPVIGLFLSREGDSHGQKESGLLANGSSFQSGGKPISRRVLDRMKEGIYLIETYGWSEGEVYDERIVSVNKMCNWRFYPDFETFGLRAQQHLKSENGIA